MLNSTLGVSAQNAAQNSAYATVPTEPLTTRLNSALSTAQRARNGAQELRGRMFGYGPPSAVDAKGGEPQSAEDVAVVTAAVLSDLESILAEINARF